MENLEMKTILVVDPGSTTRKLLAGRLEIMDFQTQEAGTPEELIAALSSRRYDLVISDVDLPGLSTQHLLQKYRTLSSPVLIFTNKMAEESWKTGQVKGVFHRSQRSELLKKVVELAEEAESLTERLEKSDQKHVLLIEDSTTIRNMLKRLIQKNFQDYVIREAADGREALSEMSNKKVDFIITDLQMPGMDGQTFLKILRSNPLLKNKPVVVLSSSITAALKGEVRGNENIRLLPKPSSDTEITSAMRELLDLEAKPCLP